MLPCRALGAVAPQMSPLLLLAVGSEGQGDLGPKLSHSQKPVPQSNSSAGSGTLHPALLLPCFPGPCPPRLGTLDPGQAKVTAVPPALIFGAFAMLQKTSSFRSSVAGGTPSVVPLPPALAILLLRALQTSQVLWRGQATRGAKSSQLCL